jgi:hypothetical protein
VDLWTPSSAAISVTPASPFLARISRIVTARSTDWTVVSRGTLTAAPVRRGRSAATEFFMAQH